MGTLNEGFLGGFSGTLGTAVGSKWKRKNVIRSRPPRKRGKSSESQIANQVKFRVMNKFLRPITDLLNQTYRKSALGMMSGFNRAFSDNSIRGAVIGEYPAFTIEYSRILVKAVLPMRAHSQLFRKKRENWYSTGLTIAEFIRLSVLTALLSQSILRN